MFLFFLNCIGYVYDRDIDGGVSAFEFDKVTVFTVFFKEVIHTHKCVINIGTIF